jgi:hypothetical protein
VRRSIHWPVVVAFVLLPGLAVSVTLHVHLPSLLIILRNRYLGVEKCLSGLAELRRHAVLELLLVQLLREILIIPGK